MVQQLTMTFTYSVGTFAERCDLRNFGKKIVPSNGCKRVEATRHGRKRSAEHTGYKETGHSWNMSELVHNKVGHELVGFRDDAQRQRVTVHVHGEQSNTTETGARNEEKHSKHVCIQGT